LGFSGDLSDTRSLHHRDREEIAQRGKEIRRLDEFPPSL